MDTLPVLPDCANCPLATFRYQVIIWVASLLHAIWAVLLFLHGGPLVVTAMGNFYDYLPWQIVAVLLLVISTSALVGTRLRARKFWVHAALFTPQQFVLLWSCFQAMACIARGSYADLVQRPPAFIGADQLILILVGVLHTYALLYHYVVDVRAE